MDGLPRNCELESSSCKEARPIPHGVDVGEVRRELGGNLDHPHAGQIGHRMERSLAVRRLGLEHRARGRQVEGGQGVDSIVGARPHGEISGESVAEKPTHGLRT